MLSLPVEVGLVACLVSAISGLLLFVLNVCTGYEPDKKAIRAYRTSMISASMAVVALLYLILMGGV